MRAAERCIHIFHKSPKVTGLRRASWIHLVLLSTNNNVLCGHDATRLNVSEADLTGFTCSGSTGFFDLVCCKATREKKCGDPLKTVLMLCNVIHVKCMGDNNSMLNKVLYLYRLTYLYLSIYMFWHFILLFNHKIRDGTKVDSLIYRDSLLIFWCLNHFFISIKNNVLSINLNVELQYLKIAILKNNNTYRIHTQVSW